LQFKEQPVPNKHLLKTSATLVSKTKWVGVLFLPIREQKFFLKATIQPSKFLLDIRLNRIRRFGR